MFPSHQEQLLEKQSPEAVWYVWNMKRELASQKVETTHMSIHSGMGKQNLEYPYNGTFSIKRNEVLIQYG